MTLKPGDTVEGRYRIIKELDQGGMGNVFLAEHELIKRRVALKLLRPELATDADVLERFMNEARAAGTLGHPNIVESTDMGFTRDQIPYIVFEFLEGSLLHDEIYRVRGMPIRRVLRIARQIASALQAAHNAGIVHRDLKSDNIFLTDRDDALDHVKVLDFGISRFLDLEDTAKTRAMVIGTPQFMAPEQITAPESVDRRADIYALGVIMYEMLAARRPFENEADPDALFPQIISEPPPALGVVDLPPGFEEMLFERFLAKAPDERFDSMQDVEQALSAFAGIVRPVGRTSTPMPFEPPDRASLGQPPRAPPTATVSPPAKRGASLGWLAAAVIAAAAGAALYVAEPKAGARAADPNLVLLQGDAEKLGAAIESATHAAQLRADGIAQTPMLRAGVETDAATVRDMFKGDFQLQLNAGDAFELLQLKDGALRPMLRVPDGTALGARTDHQPRLTVSRRGDISVLVSSPVTTQRGGTGGAIALAVPIDLSAVRAAISTHAASSSGVMLRGLDQPVSLVSTMAAGPATGEAVTIPIALPAALGVTASLAATLPVVARPAPALGYARLVCWALAGVLGFAYLVNLLRARRSG